MNIAIEKQAPSNGRSKRWTWNVSLDGTVVYNAPSKKKAKDAIDYIAKNRMTRDEVLATAFELILDDVSINNDMDELNEYNQWTKNGPRRREPAVDKLMNKVKLVSGQLLASAKKNGFKKMNSRDVPSIEDHSKITDVYGKEKNGAAMYVMFFGDYEVPWVSVVEKSGAEYSTPIHDLGKFVKQYQYFMKTAMNEGTIDEEFGHGLFARSLSDIARSRYQGEKMAELRRQGMKPYPLTSAQTFWYKLGGKVNLDKAKFLKLLSEYVRKGLVTYKPTDGKNKGIEADSLQKGKFHIVDNRIYHLEFSDRSFLTVETTPSKARIQGAADVAFTRSGNLFPPKLSKARIEDLVILKEETIDEAGGGGTWLVFKGGKTKFFKSYKSAKNAAEGKTLGGKFAGAKVYSSEFYADNRKAIESGELDEETIDEVLNAQQRLKRKEAMRKAKSKIKRGRERAKKRIASTEVLKKRAYNTAKKLVAKKLSQGKDKGSLSYAERASIEKRLARKKGAIEKLARKLLPSIKKKEMNKKKSKE